MSDANQTEFDGTAALGICEALLLAMTDAKLLTEKDARDLLTDVASAHSEAAAAPQASRRHLAVVKIVERILAGMNGVRH